MSQARRRPEAPRTRARSKDDPNYGEEQKATSCGHIGTYKGYKNRRRGRRNTTIMTAVNRERLLAGPGPLQELHAQPGDARTIPIEGDNIAAITSHVEEPFYLIEVLVKAPEGGLTVDSVVLLNQVRSVDKRRLMRRLGALTPTTMERVTRALQISLGMVEI